MPERYGRYEVRGALGKGGMATVYRGWDPLLHREVAIKVISATGAELASSRTRFEREARAIASLEHHAIVPIHEFGEEDGEAYFVMRLMNGGSLADRIEKGPMALEDLTPIIERVAQALDYAHSRGIIHRDVKPANILFDSSGAAFLSDFGIARDLDQTASLTGTAVLGSPRYMAPEQAEGKSPTPASDIYSLGVTMYEALAGKPPFVAENPLALLMMHLRDEPTPLDVLRPDLPEEALDSVELAMSKEPEERWESATIAASALTASNAQATRHVPAVGQATTRAVESTAIAARRSSLDVTQVTPRDLPRSRSSAPPEPHKPGFSMNFFGNLNLFWIIGIGVAIILVATALVASQLNSASSDDDPDENPTPTPTATPDPNASPTQRSASPQATPENQQFSAAEQVIDPATMRYEAVVATSKGTFTITLDAENAPNTVNSFVFLAQQGYFDGITFHRIIPNFVAQSGDPTGTGLGSPGYSTEDEPNEISNTRGTIAMAKASGASSFGSQWFINLKDNTALDYTSSQDKFYPFGEVTSGMDVVDQIAAVGTASGQPTEEVTILGITINESARTQ